MTCGRELAAEARFCPACGNSTAESRVASLVNTTIDTETCATCGGHLTAEARFCPACGNSTAESNEVPLFAVVDVLERILSPSGATVLIGNPAKRSSRRLEVYADPNGILTSSDKERLRSLLSELIIWDAYLHSEVVIDGRTVSCVWHIINGDIFPLTAGHGGAILLYYDAVLPKGSTAVEFDEAADAPTLTIVD
jgi:RNA polymerase subunit RPABC4/transcription elongation factor Spt4